MKRSLDRSELLAYAKRTSPEVLKVKVTERNNVISLRLSWNNLVKTIRTDHALLMNSKQKFDQVAYNAILDQTKNRIKEAILEFGKQECDNLINKFNLLESYKERFEDKNVMYKMRRDYARKINGTTVTKNLSFYYYDEIKVSIPHLYYFWTLMVQKKFRHANIDGMFDITNSIIEHIKQLFFTYDIIKDILMQAKHFGNPDTFFVFYYHFAYFVSLVKTIGDNLGWILKLYLVLKIRHVKIDLTNNHFKKTLENTKLFHDIIYSNGYYEDYKKLVGFRDVIQHRHTIKSMRALFSNGQNRILIPKDPERFISDSLKVNKVNPNSSRFKVAEDLRSVIQYGLHEYFVMFNKANLSDYDDPLEYCRKHIKGISKIISVITKRIVNEMTRKLLGHVVKYCPKANVAILNLYEMLEVGDQIMIENKARSFDQQI